MQQFNMSNVLWDKLFTRSQAIGSQISFCQSSAWNIFYFLITLRNQSHSLNRDLEVAPKKVDLRLILNL